MLRRLALTSLAPDFATLLCVCAMLPACMQRAVQLLATTQLVHRLQPMRRCGREGGDVSGCVHCDCWGMC